jgi:hypothetical protein
MRWKTFKDGEPEDESEVLIVDLKNKVYAVRCFYNFRKVMENEYLFDDLYFSQGNEESFKSWKREEIKYWARWPKPPKENKLV